jgi:subtilisin family serine protease
MDPGLEEAIRRAPPGAEIEAIALLRPGRAVPRALRVVTRFGSIVTCRIPPSEVFAVRNDPAIVSLKAARTVEPATIEYPTDSRAHYDIRADRGRARSPDWPRGRGVLVCCLDFGCDVAHEAFRFPNGRTRLVALWDQRAHPRSGVRAPYGYGRVFSRADIDRALTRTDPYAALDYHPASSDPSGRGSHGTHVMSIAAWSDFGPPGSEGLAPEGDLAFVHLATSNARNTHDLGDSVRLLEALDFVRTIAGARPWVVNLSLGRTSGDHSGRSLVEMAMDFLVAEAPGRAIVQSCGNYYQKQTAAHGRVPPGHAVDLEWIVRPDDPSENELEIYYSGRDRMRLELIAPRRVARYAVDLDHHVALELDGREIGRAYHRSHEPLTGNHHIDIILESNAPTGLWTARLLGQQISDGRYFAWIERDSPQPNAQSMFSFATSSPKYTLGTISNGYNTLVTGAYDAGTRELASFSSSGPTRDGRTKPDVLAPGTAVVGARSTPYGAAPGSGGTTLMSGTSMAAPHVTGTVALLFAAARRKLAVHETRTLVAGTAQKLERLDPDRAGNGLLSTSAALDALNDLE